MLCRETNDQTDSSTSSAGAAILFVRNWTVLDPVHLEYRPLTTFIARAVPAGQAAAHAVWFWMHLIGWPSDLTPKKGDPGITVIELLCNFLVCTGTRLPVVFNRDRIKTLTSFRDYDSTDAGMLPPRARGVGYQAETLLTIMQQLVAMTRVCSLPSFQQKSLHDNPLLYPIRKSVVAAVRPQIPYLDATLRLLVTYNCTCTSDTAAGPIELPPGLASYEPPTLENEDLPTPQRNWQLVKHRKMARQ